MDIWVCVQLSWVWVKFGTNSSNRFEIQAQKDYCTHNYNRTVGESYGWYQLRCADVCLEQADPAPGPAKGTPCLCCPPAAKNVNVKSEQKMNAVSII